MCFEYKQIRNLSSGGENGANEAIAPPGIEFFLERFLFNKKNFLQKLKKEILYL